MLTKMGNWNVQNQLYADLITNIIVKQSIIYLFRSPETFRLDISTEVLNHKIYKNYYILLLWNKIKS